MFFQRAAMLVAMTLTLGGLVSTSTPGIAAELDRPAIINASLTTPTSNAPVSALVPETFLFEQTPELTTATYDSLDEAVAAQHDAEVEDAEALRCLATTIFHESRGEPLAGQLAVANVVINRVKSGRFASDICGVVKQRGQFSFVHRGVLPAVDAAHRRYRIALGVAKVALAEAWKGPASDALFFNGRGAGLRGRLTKVALIGNHIFYR